MAAQEKVMTDTPTKLKLRHKKMARSAARIIWHGSGSTAHAAWRWHKQFRSIR
jgi:hypothetical protein